MQSTETTKIPIDWAIDANFMDINSSVLPVDIRIERVLRALHDAGVGRLLVGDDKQQEVDLTRLLHDARNQITWASQRILKLETGQMNPDWLEHELAKLTDTRSSR